MTPGDNGASTPEDDDPSGYLYADGQARGAQSPSGGYGYPNSVSRVRTVGESAATASSRRRRPTARACRSSRGAYGQPNAHYQAPETLPGGAPPPAAPHPRARPPRPQHQGLLIGAIAVVAAVVIGIGIAMINGNTDDDKSDDQANSTPTQSQPGSPTPSGSKSAPSGELPKVDGADKSLQLVGGATGASDVSGARSADGSYIGGLNQAGASVTWTVNDIPKSGKYTVYVGYTVPRQGRQRHPHGQRHGFREARRPEELEARRRGRL